MKASAIILAAGKGTRMKSEQSKCMQLVMGQPILRHIVDNLKAAGIEDIVIVIGHQGESIIDYFKDEVTYAWQKTQLGTGHAVLQASSLKNNDGKTIIINGDVPLVKMETFKELINDQDSEDLVLLSTIMKDPAKYGRIIRENGKFVRITEAKDCTVDQLKIDEINGAIYCCDNQKLWECLPLIQNNNKQQEYYLTDVVELFISKNYSVQAKVVADSDEIMGVDHRLGQQQANKAMQTRINRQHMENGVFIMDCDNTYIESGVIIGTDVQIQPNVHLKGKTIINSNSVITSGSVIDNSIIGEGSTIENSKIINSNVGAKSSIGPMAHIREYCEIGTNCRIGNFVEMKKAFFGDGSKCAHLTYLGDCEVGKNVNIGCGVVTVNYDGKFKYQTIIGDNAFIGSNCNLIAPITIGDNALVAAGSTINQDVPSNDMGIARARQINKEGYGINYKNK